jgi:hypothetical protein
MAKTTKATPVEPQEPSKLFGGRERAAGVFDSLNMTHDRGFAREMSATRRRTRGGEHHGARPARRF